MRLQFEYNIDLIHYSTNNGSHKNLLTILETADAYLPKKNSDSKIAAYVDPKDSILSQAAQAMFIHRKFHDINHGDCFFPIVLHVLSQEQLPLTPSAIAEKLKSLLTNKIQSDEILRDSLTVLVNNELVHCNDGKYQITPSGIDQVRSASEERESIKRHAFGQFVFDLAKENPAINDSDKEEYKNLAENVFISVFKNRGLYLANCIYKKEKPDDSERINLYGAAFRASSDIMDDTKRRAFFQVIQKFITSPNDSQRNYLVSISQGFFLFHMLGLDPEFLKTRKTILKQTLWFCDSSVILPLIALGCNENRYISDMLSSISRLDSRLYTTVNLMKEVWFHLDWAKQFISNHGEKSYQLYLHSIHKDGKRNNLFFEGFFNLFYAKAVRNFDDYMELVFNGRAVEFDNIKTILDEKGIVSCSIRDFPEYSHEDDVVIREIKDEIERQRRERGTYKKDFQVETEAEIYHIISNLRDKTFTINNEVDVFKFYFISNSSFMDSISWDSEMFTWNPEALYRYISSLPDKEPDPGLLQDCMLNEYYYSGIDFMNAKALESYFGQDIQNAKIEFEDQYKRYIKYTEESAESVRNAFEHTSDIQKPLFIEKMSVFIAYNADKKASQLENTIKNNRTILAEKDELANIYKRESEKHEQELLRQKKANEQLRQEISRLRNEKDPKHTRKRLRQSKKRNKKN